MPKIEHKEARVILSHEAAEDVPPDVKKEHGMVRWACDVYETAMRMAAAGVLYGTESLDKAANTLWWAGFQVPPGYLTDEEEDDYDLRDEEALRVWVERESANIEKAMGSKGFCLAGSGRLLEDVGDWRG